MSDYATINATRTWVAQAAADEAVTWSLVYGEAELTVNDTTGEGKSLRLSRDGVTAVEISAGKIVRYRAISMSGAGLARNGF